MAVMGWSGQPLLMDELLFKTQHGLIDQSLHSRMGVETTNGDGFGVGYGAGEGPAMYHSVAPAWGDANLRELAAHIETPLFLAHVRATSGTAIQQTNCHPFRHGRWLFVCRASGPFVLDRHRGRHLDVRGRARRQTAAPSTRRRRISPHSGCRASWRNISARLQRLEQLLGEQRSDGGGR